MIGLDVPGMGVDQSGHSQLDSSSPLGDQYEYQTLLHYVNSERHTKEPIDQERK